MCQPTGPVEGQELAREVLDALERDEAPDWASLDRACREPLLRAAAARLRHLDLGNYHTPEDVLHEFLLRRVYPSRRAREMLGPTARGERPLLPRLLTSLARFCIDLSRRTHRLGDGSVAIDCAVAPAELELPSFDEVEALLRRQVSAIRQACALRRGSGAPYREALLVRHRLDWASAFDGTQLEAEVGGSVVLDLDRLEELTPWTEEEATTSLVSGGATLTALWARLRDLILARPRRQVNPEELARLVPAARDQWNQWLCRGRRRLEEGLGEDFDRLFPLWSGQGGGT